MFHYTVTTDKSLDEAVKALEATLKERKFGILWDFDITATLQNKGFDFQQPYRVLEVCSPGEANKVLTTNSMVGYFLPCKIVVYEKDGQNYIGMPKPTQLINMVDDSSLRETAERVEQNLMQAIDAAK
ncbi:MAG: DUF302 domain-containing protein [Bacillaceae bacterium]|nr:DUF302 domain-containing protein [Bacillaceae bacterium]